MKTETAAYSTERQKLTTQPRYYVRFFHVKTAGDGADYAFSRDFSSGAILAPTKTKLQYLSDLSGGPAQVIPEQGRATIGGYQITLLDAGGEILRYCSAPALTLKTAMTAVSPGDGGFVELNEDPGGLPAVGTIQVTTAGVIERVRYDLVDTVNDRVRVATGGRGVDGTTAAAHSIGDAVTNGERIRAGQRAQLFAGYAPLNEADYLSLVKMEISDVALSPEGAAFVVSLQDLQRTARKRVFLTAKEDAALVLTGNPVTLALQVLTSTGTGTNGAYDVLAVENGLGIPQAFVDIAGMESLRDTEFAGQVYDFRITGAETGKDWIEREIWKTLNCYMIVTQDGKLSARRYKPAPSPGSVTETLTDADLIGAEWSSGAPLIINQVLVQYDWNLASSSAAGGFGRFRLYTFDVSKNDFGGRPTLTISSQGLKSAQAGHETWIDERAFMVGKRFADPPPILKVRVFYRKHVWEVGDAIKVTLSRVPNLKTGARGLTDEVFEIVDMRPRFGRQAGLELTLLHTGAITLPAAPSNGGTVQTPVPLPRDTTPPAVPTGLAVAMTSEVLVDGTFIGIADATWTANAETDLSHYVLRFRKTGSAAWADTLVAKLASPRQLIRGLSPSTSYEFQVAAVDQSLNVSAFSATITQTTPADPGAPAVPTGLALTAFPQTVALTWNRNAETDIAYYGIQRADDAGFTVNLFEFSTDSIRFIDRVSDVATRFYRIRAVRRSGSVSAYTASVSGAAVDVDAVHLDPLVQAALADTPDNLIVNPGGERGTLGSQAFGWTIAAGNPLTIAEDQAKFGVRSLKFDHPSALESWSFQQVPLVGGAVYELSGWIKTSALPTADPGLGAFLNIDISTGIGSWTIIEKLTVGPDPNAGEPDCGIAADGVAHEWTFVRSRFVPASDGVINVIVQLGYSGTQSGTAWFDGLVLKRRYQIATADMIDLAVTTAKIAAAAITSAKIANAAIVTALIADAQIATAKIIDLNVTTAKIADLAVIEAKIAALAVTTAKIADLAVTNAKIAALAVDNAKIADGSITNAKIGNLEVDSAKIANGAITNAKIGNLEVDSAKIANLTVGSDKITGGAVNNNQENQTDTEVQLSSSETTLQTVNITTNNANASLELIGDLNLSGLNTASMTIVLRLYRGAVLLRSTEFWLSNGDASVRHYQMASLSKIDAPGSGTFSYTLRAIITAGTGTGWAKNRRLFVGERKK